MVPTSPGASSRITTATNGSTIRARTRHPAASRGRAPGRRRRRPESPTARPTSGPRPRSGRSAPSSEAASIAPGMQAVVQRQRKQRGHRDPELDRMRRGAGNAIDHRPGYDLAELRVRRQPGIWNSPAMSMPKKYCTIPSIATKAPKPDQPPRQPFQVGPGPQPIRGDHAECPSQPAKDIRPRSAAEIMVSVISKTVAGRSVQQLVGGLADARRRVPAGQVASGVRGQHRQRSARRSPAGSRSGRGPDSSRRPSPRPTRSAARRSPTVRPGAGRPQRPDDQLRRDAEPQAGIADDEDHRRQGRAPGSPRRPAGTTRP